MFPTHPPTHLPHSHRTVSLVKPRPVSNCPFVTWTTSFSEWVGVGPLFEYVCILIISYIRNKDNLCTYKCTSFNAPTYLREPFSYECLLISKYLYIQIYVHTFLSEWVSVSDQRKLRFIRF